MTWQRSDHWQDEHLFHPKGTVLAGQVGQGQGDGGTVWATCKPCWVPVDLDGPPKPVLRPEDRGARLSLLLGLLRGAEWTPGCVPTGQPLRFKHGHQSAFGAAVLGLKKASDFWVWLRPCLPRLLRAWGDSASGSTMQMLGWVGRRGVRTGGGCRWVIARDLKPSVSLAESEVLWVAD